MSEENTEAPEVLEAAIDERGSLLESSSVELGDGEFFLSEGIKGQGDMPEWYLSDKYGSVSEQAKGYSELQKKFGSFTGAPKEGYTLPEGFEKDDSLAQEVIQFGEETNLNQEGFDKLMELATAKEIATQEVSQESEMAKLGDNAGQRIKNVESALKFKLGDQYDSVASLVTSADSVMLAEALIKSYAPTKLPIDGGEHPEGLTWDDVQKEMFRKDSEGNLLRSVNLEHEKKVQRMLKEFGGNKPNVVTVG